MLGSGESKEDMFYGYHYVEKTISQPKHERLPYYTGENELKQRNIDFESAREIFMKEDDKMVVKRRPEGIKNLIETKPYMKHEDVPEIKEISFMDSNVLKQMKSITIN